MYMYFKNYLLNIMGEDARHWEVTGLSYAEHKFFPETGYTIAKIDDYEKAKKYESNKNVEILTLEQANAKIDELYVPEYSIYNEGLVNANLNQKIAKGDINLDEMQPDWTQQQEAEWLYKKGISGIRISEKIPYFIE